MTAGTRAKAFRSYGWHQYAWSDYSPPVDANLAWGVWNTFGVSIDADTRALSYSGKINFNGWITVVWGERPGAYYGQSAPFFVTAGATFNGRITGLKPGTQYYCNAYANITATLLVGGVPQSGTRQYGEVTQTTGTPSGPSLVAPQSADNSGGGGNVDFQIGTSEASTGYIDWGLTTAYGTQRAFTGGDGTLASRLVVSIVGTIGQTYHWRAVVTSKATGLTTVGPDHSVGPLT